MIERAEPIVESPTEPPVSATPSEVHSSARCLNCGTPLTQRFCPSCGQAAIDPDPTLREFLHDMAAELLLWDGKLFTTFRLLLTKPGELTREYLAGHRVRYIAPFKLYLTCSVLYFFLHALAPDAPVVVRTGGVVTTQVGGITVKEQGDGDALAALDRIARSQSREKRVVASHMGNALRHKAEFAAAMRENQPRMMFVLVPLFAALAALVFRSRRMHYPKHLTFALHTHAFLFLALIPTLVPRVTHNTLISVPAVVASFVAIAIYLVLSSRRVYGGSRAAAFGRTALLAGSYFIVFTIALLVTVALVMAVRF